MSIMPSLSPSPRNSLKRPRPSRLHLALVVSAAGVGGGGVSIRTPPPLSPMSPNCPPAASRKLRCGGGFANFAANYPQYCECKCPAAAACCQPLVEPSYSVNRGPTQLLDYIFVGSQSDATDADTMQRHGITHVLNVSANCTQSEHVPEGHFLRVSVNDGYADKLLPHFQRAFQFLDNVRLSNGRCLVHCLAGVSRSATMAIAYIMQHMQMSQEEAYRYVKTRRPSISPNFNFLGQLLEFERQLKRAGCDAPEAVVAADAAAADADSDACPEAKRQRRFFQLRAASPLSTSVSAGPSPTSALSQLTFAQQQQQQAAVAAAALATVANGSAVVPCCSSSADSADGRIRRRQRPRSVALTTATAATDTAAATTAAAASGGSQEIPCS